jgi:hypothetical protein
MFWEPSLNKDRAKRENPLEYGALLKAEANKTAGRSGFTDDPRAGGGLGRRSKPLFSDFDEKHSLLQV